MLPFCLILPLFIQEKYLWVCILYFIGFFVERFNRCILLMYLLCCETSLFYKNLVAIDTKFHCKKPKCLHIQPLLAGQPN